jgi:hypothetical protein
MTTAQTMLKSHRLPGLCLAVGAALVSLASVLGCSSEPKLVAPAEVRTPYDTSRAEPLWAVVPLRNESGTTSADVLAISDKVVAAAAQVRGVRTLPLNRTIAAMQSLNLPELSSPAEATALAKQMGVDALILGSITAYDPYDPPKLGLALALYPMPGAPGIGSQPPVDPHALEGRPTDYQYFPRSNHAEAPAAVVSEYLDGKNQGVQIDLRDYAKGRHNPEAALGWRRYLTSMDLYSEFAAWHAVRSLVNREWVRLTGSPPAAKKK